MKILTKREVFCRETEVAMWNIVGLVNMLNNIYAKRSCKYGVDVELTSAIEALGVAHGMLTFANEKVQK